MSKLKTVKEVCELTGLNRKALFDYDKAGVVKPADHYNNAHEGLAKKKGVKVNYCGYKLYDEEAVRLLQQIHIFEKLNVKKSEIIHRMKTAKNLNDLLDEQIHMLHQKEQEIKELLIIAEQLKMLGMQGEISRYYANFDFSKLAQNVMRLQESQLTYMLEKVLSKSTEESEKEVDSILEKLLSILEFELKSEDTMKIVKELLTTVKRNYGFIGWVTAISIAFVVEGGGEVADELVDEYSKEEVINCARAICIYVKKDLNKLLDECIDIVTLHYDVIGKDFTEPEVKEMVNQLKVILFMHTGIGTKDEYVMFFDWMKDYDVLKSDECLYYALEALEYYQQK